MGAIGFSLGTTLMVVLGVTWSWLIVLVGLLVGVALAALAIVGDLPLLVLAVLGAFAGASVTITGLLLLGGTLGSDDLAATSTTTGFELGTFWTIAYLLLAVAGLSAQLASADARDGAACAGPGAVAPLGPPDRRSATCPRCSVRRRPRRAEPATAAAVGDRVPLPGVWGALLLAWASFTPSLLPRGPITQGIVGGISAAIGYGLGLWPPPCGAPSRTVRPARGR